MGPPLWKTAWQAFKVLNMDLSYDPEISLVGTYMFKKIKNICPLTNQWMNVYHIIIHNSQKIKNLKH